MKRFLSFVLISYIIFSSLVCFAEEITFSDVNELDWFYSDVQYVYENKLMNGTSNIEFSPEEKTTRGMIVTILWRLEGEPFVNGKEFKDVVPDAYYYKAVSWAAFNNIVSGYSEDLFGPEDFATREQLAVIMNRYASYKKYDLSKTVSLDGYKDKNEISDYAVESIAWATVNGIIKGTTNETLSPKGFVPRCQIAAILKRMCINVIVTTQNTEPHQKSETETELEEDSKEDMALPNKENDVLSNGDGEKYEENNPSVIASKPEEENNMSSDTEIFVSNVTGKPGEEIKVAINVKNNPGILGMVLAVYYDEEKCTLINAENGRAFENILNLTTSKTLESASRFVWDGIDINDKEIKDGEILVMTFKIIENAPGGICQIEIKSINDDIMNKNLETIYPQISGGHITIVSE